VLNVTDGEGFTALGLACRDLKCEAGQGLISLGCNVDKLSNDRHPAYLVGKALHEKYIVSPVDAMTLESVTLLIKTILEKSIVDHKADEYVSREALEKFSGIAYLINLPL
jgi:hypothetical protein